MKKSTNQTALTLVLWLFSALIFASTMFRSGLVYDFGVGFWGPNGHDAVWHLALIESLKHSVPPENPLFAGVVLKNYHWGFDLAVALMSKVSRVSSSILYFQLIPLIFALSIGIVCYKLVRVMGGAKFAGVGAVWLVYFAGSFGWLVTLLTNGSIGGESLFWSMQAVSTLINPPFAMSLIILFSSLLVWQKYRQTNSVSVALLLGLLLAILSTVKIYAGILLGLAYLFYPLFLVTKHHKPTRFDILLVVAGAVFSILALVFMGISLTSDTLVFQPLWFVHTMIESLDKLYLPTLATLRQNLAVQPMSWKLPFFILIELMLVGIFIVGNLGVRVLSIFELKQRCYKAKPIDILLKAFLGFSLGIPLVFIQKGTSWNTIQFFYYFLFVASLYTALWLERVYKKGTKWAKVSVLAILLLAIPTTISTLRGYWGYPPPAALSRSELQALAFLHAQPYGRVLSFPFDRFAQKGHTPIPLFMYETTAYVSAYSAKPSFLADEMNLEITGYPWQQRKKEVDAFFSTTNVYQKRGFLVNNQIDYVYLLTDQALTLDQNLGLAEIFTNNQVRIYKVTR